jgi:Fe-S cluster assembly protein SufB
MDAGLAARRLPALADNARADGLSAEEATAPVVNGFVKDVLQQLPMEFAVEAQKLISVSLEGSVG